MAHRIYFQVDEKWVPVEEGQTILEASLQAGIPHTHVCGGQARCSTCRVMVTQGLENLTPRTPKEQALATRLGFTPDIRLACQTKVTGQGILRRLVLDEQDLALASQLSPNRIDAVGVEKFIVVLFADLRGFTAFAESVPGYDAMHVLNRHFMAMGEVIQRNGGYIDNYMGDGLMAIFGLEKSLEATQAIKQAVGAGLEMLEAMEGLNIYLQTLYGRSLDIGIGIHCGEAVVGELGAASHKKLTAIGDTVNLASRIEQFNKQTGTRLLVSEAVYEQVKLSFEAGREFLVPLKGKSGLYQLYEITAAHPQNKPVADEVVWPLAS